MTQKNIAIGFIAEFTNYRSDNWKGGVVWQNHRIRLSWT